MDRALKTLLDDWYERADTAEGSRTPIGRIRADEIQRCIKEIEWLFRPVKENDGE